MKIAKNKIAVAFALFLVFAMTFSLFALPATNAQTTGSAGATPVAFENLARTCFTPYPGPTTAHVLWETNVGHVVLGAIQQIVADDQVFTGAYVTGAATGPDFFDFNATTGQLIWNATLYSNSEVVTYAPTYYDGSVYIDVYNNTSGAATLYAVNAANGHTLWTFDANASLTLPTVYNNLVWTPGLNAQGNGYFYGLNNATGQIVDSFPTQYMLMYISMYNGDVFALNTEGQVTCWDLTTGQELWIGDYTTFANGPLVLPPGIYPYSVCNLAVTSLDVYVVYVAYGGDMFNTPAYVAAFNTATGAGDWWRPTSACCDEIGVAYNTLYLGSYAGTIEARGIEQAGSVNTEFDVGQGGSSATPGGIGMAIAGNDMLYFAALNGVIYALNTQTLNLVWESQPMTWFSSTGPTLAYGNVYIGDHLGEEYCFGDAPASSMSISTSPSPSITLGQSLDITGTLVDAAGTGIANATITLGTRTEPNVAWYNLATVTTASDGSFSYTYTPPSAGDWDFNASYTGPYIGGYASSNAMTTVSVGPVAAYAVPATVTGVASTGTVELGVAAIIIVIVIIGAAILVLQLRKRP